MVCEKEPDGLFSAERRGEGIQATFCHLNLPAPGATPTCWNIILELFDRHSHEQGETAFIR